MSMNAENYSSSIQAALARFHTGHMFATLNEAITLFKELNYSSFFLKDENYSILTKLFAERAQTKQNLEAQPQDTSWLHLANMQKKVTSIPSFMPEESYF